MIVCLDPVDSGEVKIGAELGVTSTVLNFFLKVKLQKLKTVLHTTCS